MLTDIYYPATLTGDELDDYLSQGWYRMGRGLFSTDNIYYEDELLNVYWLRYNLQKIQFNKSHHKLISKNRHFSIEIKPLVVTEELEALYSLYESSITFEAPRTVRDCLYDRDDAAAFDSHIIEIRDEGTLIAAGVVDYGNQSIAGIMNFYHPAYKKYSLGKYLMLLTVEHGRAIGKHWYYPGYIAYGNPKFDYKLFIDETAAEFYLAVFRIWMGYKAELIKGLGEGTFDYEAAVRELLGEKK
jgi:arginine-tRNA-protein transferase